MHKIVKIRDIHISLMLLLFIVPLYLFVIAVKINSYMIMSYETQKVITSIAYIIMGLLLINFLGNYRIYNV